MLEDQIHDFAAQDRFVHAVLGLLSLGDRVAALATLARVDGGQAPPTPVADLLLGLISVQRTLRATLTCDAAGHTRASPPAPDSPADQPAAARLPSRILR